MQKTASDVSKIQSRCTSTTHNEHRSGVWGVAQPCILRDLEGEPDLFLQRLLYDMNIFPPLYRYFVSNVPVRVRCGSLSLRISKENWPLLEWSEP